MTWEAQNIYSIIDLVFLSELLAERLEHCKSRLEMDQFSDYIPISTKLQLASKTLSETKRRAFKLLDIDKLKELERQALLPPTLQSVMEIDDYTSCVQEHLQKIIKVAVSWARPCIQAKPFWNDAYNQATKTIRTLRQVWFGTQNEDDWTAYMHFNDRKQKVIKKAKNLFYQK